MFLTRLYACYQWHASSEGFPFLGPPPHRDHIFSQSEKVLFYVSLLNNKLKFMHGEVCSFQTHKKREQNTKSPGSPKGTRALERHRPPRPYPTNRIRNTEGYAKVFFVVFCEINKNKKKTKIRNPRDPKIGSPRHGVVLNRLSASRVLVDRRSSS